MLNEFRNTKQIKGESRRRWFSDQYFDLIVWLDGKNKIKGFQLCYDKKKSEHALTWRKESGYTHHLIDTGETIPEHHKATPILVSDGVFDYKAIASIFKKESQEIDQKVANFVYKKILKY